MPTLTKRFGLATRAPGAVCWVFIMWNMVAAPATRTWSGLGADGFWTTPANWVGNVAPVSGDALVFPAGASRLTNTNNFAAGTDFGTISINAADYNIYGNAIDLIGNINTSYSPGLSIFRPNLTLTDHRTVVMFFASDLATLELAGDINLGAFTLTFVCEANVTLSGAVSGTGGITKGRMRTLRLLGNSANTYGGLTSIGQGPCELGKVVGQTAVAGPIEIGNTIGGIGQVRLLANDQISNSSTVTVFAASSLELNGFNDSIDSLSLTSGVVTTLSGVLTLLGGVETKASSTPSSVAGNLAMGGSGDRTFNIANGAAPVDLDITAVVSGPGSVGMVKGGLGEMRLAGNVANTFSGQTTVTAGTLALNKSAGIAIAGPLVVGQPLGAINSDIVRLDNGHQIGNTVAVTINRSGLLDLNNENDAIGALTMSAGNVDTGTGTLTPGGTVSGLANATSATIAGRLALGSGVARTFDIAAGATMQINAIITGGPGITLVKTNTGELSLTVSNLYDGPTLVQQGTLTASINGAFGSSVSGTVLQGGILRLIGATGFGGDILTVEDGQIIAVGSCSWLSNVILNGDLEVLSAGAADVMTFTAEVSGAGGFIKNGDGVLNLRGTVSNTHTGTNVVNNGELQLYKFLGGSEIVAVPGPLVIGDGIGAASSARVVYGGPDQIADAAPIFIRPDGILDLRNWIDDIGPITMTSGAVDTGATGTMRLLGDVVVNAAPVAAVMSGHIILTGGPTRTLTVGDGADANDLQIPANLDSLGGTGLTKEGTGRLWLSGANGHAGATLINAGSIYMTHAAALGLLGQGTTVANGASLRVAGGLTVAENLVLHGNGGGAGGALINVESANTFTGGIGLGNQATIAVFGAAGQLTLSGAISGVGGLDKNGPRNLVLTGAAANTYAGPTVVRQATLVLNKPLNVTAIPGALTIGDDNGGVDADVVQTLASGQIADTAAVTITSSGLLNLDGGVMETVGSFAGSGNVIIDGGRLIAGDNNASTTFSGVMSGTGQFRKSGAGSLTLTGNSLYSGGTIVIGGILVADGTHPNSASMTVQNGATLSGNGSFAGPISAQAGSTIAPGTSPGLFTGASSITFAGNSTFRVELNGLVAGAGYDQLSAPGPISLGGSTLDASLGFNPAVGSMFRILNNSGGAAVVGTFAGLAEGAQLAVSGKPFRISYVGGTGNDVVLTRLQAPASSLNSIQALPGGHKLITGSGIAGLEYTIEASTDLVDWRRIGTATANSSGIYEFTDDGAARLPHRFYRAVSP